VGGVVTTASVGAAVVARPVVEGTGLGARVVRGVVATAVVTGVAVVPTDALKGTVDAVVRDDDVPHAAANTTATAPIAQKRPTCRRCRR